MNASIFSLAQEPLWSPWMNNPWIRIAIIIAGSWLALRVAKIFTRRFVNLSVRTDEDTALERVIVEKRRATLVQLLNTTLAVLIVLGAVFMVGRELNFDIAPLIASAGIAGLAIGFGAQALVKDLITGAFIVFENQFNVGDIIKAGECSGLVEEINLRTTVLRDLSGTVHVIPNSSITTVSVLTKGWSRLVLDVDVAYGENIERVNRVLGRVLDDYSAANSNMVIDPPQILGVENLGESAVTVRALVKTIPGKQWEAGRALRALVKSAFDKENIEIPFPQRSVWFRAGAGVEGAAVAPRKP